MAALPPEKYAVNAMRMRGRPDGVEISPRQSGEEEDLVFLLTIRPRSVINELLRATSRSNFCILSTFGKGNKVEFQPHIL